MRDVVLPDHDFNVDAEIIRAAEDLDDPADRLVTIFGKFKNLDVDHHAVEIFGRAHLNWSDADAIAIHRSRRYFHAFRNQYPLANSLVMRSNKISTLANSKFADDGLVRAPQNLDDLAVGTAVLFNASDAHHYAIAMHGRSRRFARDVNVAAQAFDGVVGNQKSVTIAMHVEAADRIFAAEARDYKTAGADFDELAFFDQPIESILEFIARCNARAQFADQLLERGTGVRQP